MLTSILHTVQMGQSGIRAVENAAVSSGMQTHLHAQMQEYDRIESKSMALAAKRNWQLPKINSAVTTMSSMGAKCRLMARNKDSTIAGMLIQGNTRGIILGVRNLNQSKNLDPEIHQLANELLNLENTNIQKSQVFL